MELNQRYSDNPLIRGAEVINHFREQGRGLTEKQIERAIIDNAYARELVQSGQITKQERARLRAQASDNLRQREPLSELKGVGFAQEYDVTADAALENDNESLNLKKQTDDQRYRRQIQIASGQGTSPGIRGDIDGQLKERIRSRRAQIAEDRYKKPDGIRRKVYEPARPGFDYEDITLAPASGVRGTTAQQILGATRAGDAARSERQAMQDEVKKMIAADEARLTDEGRKKRIVNEMIARGAYTKQHLRSPVNPVLSNPNSLFEAPPVTANALQLVSTAPPFLAPGGGVVGYADQNLQSFLGGVPDDVGVANKLGMRTKAELAAMSDPAYVQQFSGLTAQQFIDNFNTPGEFGKQVTIDAPLELSNFVQKLRQMAGLNVLPTTFSDIRTASELDKAVNNAVGALQAEKKNLFLAKPQQGIDQAANIYVKPNEAGVLEILDKMRYEDAEKRYLAMALDQLQQARSNQVNAAQKYAYFKRQPMQGPADPRRGTMFTGAGEAIDEFKKSRINLQQDSRMRVDDDASIGALPTDKPASQQRSLLRRGPFYSRQTGESRGPIKAREHNMNALNAERQRRQLSDNPMTRDEYVAGVQDTREKQVQNYVTQVRASRDRKRRAQKQQDILNRRGMPPAEPTVPSSVGYGDDLRQVQQAAADQTSDMALSDLIRRQRSRRGA